MSSIHICHPTEQDLKDLMYNGDFLGMVTISLSEMKSEVSTFPIVVIFFRGCVSEMVVLSYSVIYYIYIPGKLGLCFHSWCSVYGICKRSDTLWPVGRVRLFADYTISLSSLCRLIWRHWTTKMLVRYRLPSVCLRLRQFSQLSFIQYMGCVSSAYPFLLRWSWECVLYLIIIIKPEVWIINHCLGLGHETMVCAVCLTMFLWCWQLDELISLAYCRFWWYLDKYSRAKYTESQLMYPLQNCHQMDVTGT